MPAPVEDEFIYSLLSLNKSWTLFFGICALCVAYVHMVVWEYGMFPCVLLHCSLPYFFESGFATNPGARLAAEPGNPPVPILTGLGLHGYVGTLSLLNYSAEGSCITEPSPNI